MIVKLELDPSQLHQLHLALEEETNRYVHRVPHPGRQTEKLEEFFVTILKVTEAKSSQATRTGPVPKKYSVDLEVREVHPMTRDSQIPGVPHKSSWVLTPLDRLSRVLQAIGRFPDEEGIKPTNDVERIED